MVLFMQIDVNYSLKIPVSSSHPTKVTTLEAFQQNRNAFKVIAGLHNFDTEYVSRVAKAANVGGASHLDIACSPELVKSVRALIDSARLSICVSGVEAESFVPAVEAGADMVEIGNFDGFYQQGKEFSAKEIVSITTATRGLCPDVALSVTVPHTLPLDEQMVLAKELENCGADLIQTEGKVIPLAPSGIIDSRDSIQRAATTLASTFAIAKTVSIPVMCSSGLDECTSAIALKLGANGVGVGRYITQHHNDIKKMEEVTRRIALAMNRQPISNEMHLTANLVGDLLNAKASTKAILRSHLLFG